MKKLISFAMAVMMLLSCLAISISASGDGTEGNEIIETVGVQTQATSWLDSAKVVDSQVELLYGWDGNNVVQPCATQSATMTDGTVTLVSDVSADGWPRVLLKSDETISASEGYTHVYIDITFTNVDTNDGANRVIPSIYVGTDDVGNGEVHKDSNSVDRNCTMKVCKRVESIMVSGSYNFANHTNGISLMCTLPDANTKLNGTYTWVYELPENYDINRLFIYPNNKGIAQGGEVTISSVKFAKEAVEPADEMSMRFVSVLKDENLTNYSEIGFKVTATIGGDTSAELSANSGKVYTSVIGAGNEYTPESEGGKYFSVLRIDNVPLGQEIVFIVTAYVKKTDGTVIEATPVNYTVAADGTIS